MPRLPVGTSLPVALRATSIRAVASVSASGGAEGSSRCAGMSLPYGRCGPGARGVEDAAPYGISEP